MDRDDVVAVVGLGYVGLPLAVAFGRTRRTIGFDLSEAKVASYRQGIDPTGEVSAADLRAATQFEVTIDPALLAQADVIIVAVPTPVDAAHNPDFGPLVAASRSVGAHLKRGAIVVFESTVYPGATEEVCVPVIEKSSGLAWRKDFHVGFSPERINPGDREHGLATVPKLVSGDDAATLERVAALYETVVLAGVHRASCIRVAEAAKVIENTQRDLNIALMNELAIIFDRMGLDTLDVLQAAGTKWNFLPFRPGLVGGHCIGVDPYYVLRELPQVRVFRVEQESLSLTRVLLVLDAPLDEGLRSRIVQGFRARLGERVEVDVRQVAALAPERSGKFRFVVSKLAAEP